MGIVYVWNWCRSTCRTGASKWLLLLLSPSLQEACQPFFGNRNPTVTPLFVLLNFLAFARNELLHQFHLMSAASHPMPPIAHRAVAVTGT